MPARRQPAARTTGVIEPGVSRDDSIADGVEVPVAPLSSALLQLVRAHAGHATALLAQLGLTPPQELVLLFLHEHGPSPQRHLVRYLGRDRSTVTATVQVMERHGLIDRRPSTTDGRAITLALTAKGAALAPQVSDTWQQLELATFGSFSDRDRAAFTRLLTTARAALAPTAPDNSAKALRR